MASRPMGGLLVIALRLNMLQASLATGCKFATGLHIVGSGISALLEMRTETVQRWTLEIQWKC
jgi:hypothetical protein